MKSGTSIADAIRAEIAEHEEMIHSLKTALAVLGGEKKPGRPAASAQKVAAPKKPKMSAAGRKRIADAAKARWAKLRAEKAKAAK